MRGIALNMNGISVAYLIGFVNAVMVTVNAFGVHLDDTQRVAVGTMINAGLILAVHLGHRVGEANASGQAAEVTLAKMEAAVEHEGTAHKPKKAA